MADLVKALEADLFGAYEWAVDQYLDLQEVPEAPVRLLVAQGLFRAYEALDETDAAAEAADALVEAESALDADARTRLESVAAAREKLLDAEEPEAQLALARPFLDAFDAAWEAGPKDDLLGDALLAALTRANLLASRGRATPGDPDALTAKGDLIRWAAETYVDVGRRLRERVTAGALVWQETARACHNRAMVAWRNVGDEARAKEAEDTAANLGGGGAAWYV